MNGEMDHDRDANDVSDVLSLINEGIVSIPAVPNYRYLQRQLVELNLHSNELTSLEGLGHLSALKYLDLSSNNINAMDVSEFWNLQSLVH